jgi:hypothetical protein
MSISMNVDIDIDEIIDSIWRKGDKIELLERLLDDLDPADVLKTIKSHQDYTDKTNQVRAALTGDDYSFNSACNKLAVNRWRMNLEDEQYILNLADKL